MNDLHEIYAKLLKRGMPPHERLGCDDSGTFSLRAKVKCSDCAKTEDVSLLFDRDDARDVLTMHALTNLGSIIHKARVAQRWQEGWNLFLDEDYWSGRCTVFKFTAQTILETISAAIAHIEGA